MDTYTGPVSVFSGVGKTLGLGNLAQVMTTDATAPATTDAAHASTYLDQVRANTTPMLLGGIASHMTGSALGGALIGYVASSDSRGAGTGALFTAGLAGLGDAVVLAMASRGGLAALAGLAGGGALAGAVWLAWKRRRRPAMGMRGLGAMRHRRRFGGSRRFGRK